MALSEVKKWREQWTVILQGTVWLSAAAGSLMLPPPEDISGGDPNTAAFCAFAIAFFAGLMIVPVRLYRFKEHSRWWLGIAVALVLSAIVGRAWYGNLRRDYSVDYNGKRVAIGRDSALTAIGKIRRDTPPQRTNKELVADILGQPQVIWSAASIGENANLMQTAYVVSTILFAASIIALVQALKCNAARATPIPKTGGVGKVSRPMGK